MDGPKQTELKEMDLIRLKWTELERIDQIGLTKTEVFQIRMNGPNGMNKTERTEQHKT